jgi:hypothetical protein
MLTRLKNKITHGLTQSKNLVKDHPALVIVLLLVLGVFVIPFLILGYNFLRNRSPDALKKALPAAKPIDAAAAVEKAKPGTLNVNDASPS